MGLPKFTINARFWLFAWLTTMSAMNAVAFMVEQKWGTAILCAIGGGICGFVCWGNYRDSKGAP